MLDGILCVLIEEKYMFETLYPNLLRFIERRNAVNTYLGGDVVDLREGITQPQAEDMAREIDDALAPERLYRDGEATQKEAHDSYNFYIGCWKELVKLTGIDSQLSNAA